MGAFGTGHISKSLFVIFCLVVTLGAQAFDPRATQPSAATGTVEVAFSPWHDAEGAVRRAIDGASKEIYVQAFLFTSRAIARTLVEAKNRGVHVEVLVDGEMNRRGDTTQIRVLAAAGIPVAFEVRYAAAHNKIIIIDPQEAHCAVVTGSYNFTYAARAKNAENVIVLRDDRTVTRAYYDNWRRHRADAVPYEASHTYLP